jgi:hypothetical protein
VSGVETIVLALAVVVVVVAVVPVEVDAAVKESYPKIWMICV